MNRRIALAIGLSVLIHWGVFNLLYGQLKQPKTIVPEVKQILVTMSNIEPARHTEPRVKKTLGKSPIPEKPKPVEPVSFKPQLKPVVKQKIIQKKEPPVTASTKTLPPSPPEKQYSVKEIGQNHDSAPPEKAHVKKVTQARPAYKMNPPPVYPKIARRRGNKGTVVLDVLVGTSGNVKELRVHKSSGFHVLDNAALESVKSWVFEAGTIGYKKVDMWVMLPVRFELQ